MENGLGNFYKVNRNERGSITLKSTGKQGKMTKEQSEFFNLLSRMINNSNDFEEYIELNSSSTNNGGCGGIGPGNIDIGDVEQELIEGPSTQRGTIARELYENVLRYSSENVDYKAYLVAHKRAIIEAENKANNSIRIDRDLPSSNYRLVNNKLNGNIDQIYVKDGIKYIVSTTFVNGNVQPGGVKVTPVIDKKK